MGMKKEINRGVDAERGRGPEVTMAGEVDAVAVEKVVAPP
jgi:hypothetical protein